MRSLPAFHSLRLLARLRGLTASTLLAGALVGCAHQQPAVNRIARFDLGPWTSSPAPASDVTAPASVSSVSKPLLKVLDVSAPTALDNDQIHYRLVYADPHRAYVYGGSRWSASAAQLLTQRLRNTLAPSMRLLDGGDAESAPLLKVEVLDFSQRFDAPGKGRGVVVLRASLRGPASSGGHLMAQHEFSASVPSPEPNAEGGASAIAAATDQVLTQIGGWLAQQPLNR